jgi:hypothetical protein
VSEPWFAALRKRSRPPVILLRGDLVDNGWKRRALAAEARVRELERVAAQRVAASHEERP